MPEEAKEGGGSAIELPYLTAAAAVAVVAPAAGDEPARRGVLFELEGEQCVVRAANGTSTIELRIPGQAGLSGKQRVLLDHAALKDGLTARGKGMTPTQRAPWVATIAAGAGGPLLTVDGWTVPLDGCDAQPAPEAPLDAIADLAVEDFKAAVEAAAAAATAKDEAMPHLRGLLLELTSRWITFAGSDRYRLAATPVPAADTCDLRRLPLKLLVDGPTLAAVAKHFVADRVTIGWGQETMGGVMSFTCGGVTLWTRELEGPFLDVRELVTPAGTVEVRVDRAQLEQVAVCAAAFAARESGKVIVRFDRETVTVRPALRERADELLVPVLKARTSGLSGPLEVWYDGADFAAALKWVRTAEVAIHPAPAPARTMLAAGTGGSPVRVALAPRKPAHASADAVASAA